MILDTKMIPYYCNLYNKPQVLKTLDLLILLGILIGIGVTVFQPLDMSWF